MPRLQIRAITAVALLACLVIFLYRRQDVFLDNALKDYDKVDDDRMGVGPKYNPNWRDPAHSGPYFPKGTAKPVDEPYTRMLVMGRLKDENVNWVDKEKLNVNTTFYVVDDPDAENKVPKNKGREAMVYLSYIIDHYDDLSDTTLFFHPHSGAWHNNILLGLDSATTIQRLSDARVAREGYMNARCHLDPGCPDWLHVDRPKEEWDYVKKNEERFLTSALWAQLHGKDTPLPPALSQPCCAQFAVSRERIRGNKKEVYEHYRNWILETDLTDEISGRIMEYTWQYIFTGAPEFCPEMHQCYCDGFGICFGGRDPLQNWLDILKKREHLDDVLDELKKEGKDDTEEKKEVEKRKEEIDRELDRLKDEAYERGEDPKNRATEAGREWKEGDGY